MLDYGDMRASCGNAGDFKTVYGVVSPNVALAPHKVYPVVRLMHPTLRRSVWPEFQLLSRLSRSFFKLRLLRRLRVTLEEKPLGEIAAILDLEDVGSFFFEGLLEVVLSTAEGEKVRGTFSLVIRCWLLRHKFVVSFLVRYAVFLHQVHFSRRGF